MTDSPPLPTEYAPAERAPRAVVERQAQAFQDSSPLPAVFNALPAAVFVLNAQRQIVYANAPAAAFVPGPAPEGVISQRPGEALDCIHATTSAGGCGTTEFCRECGAVNAILTAQEGRPGLQDCRITRRRAGREEALDLRLQATPFEHAGEPYTIFTAVDISHEKRRQALERTFFHDLNNTAGILSNLTYLLEREPEVAANMPMARLLAQVAERLADEIEAQRQLLAAENDELQPQLETVEARAFLEELGGLYRRHEAAQKRGLQLAPAGEAGSLVTDPILLGRVLGNMLKNALEASQPGETVTAGCERAGEHVRFWVHNPAVMPRAVQLQIFQRSFSTKGAGRGLGTYSLKLLGERCLGGRVAFTSAEGAGTTFEIWLPAAGPLPLTSP